MSTEFTPFPKLSRLFRRVIITEKIDGTNACVAIVESQPDDGALVQSNGLSLFAGSRTRWITPSDDNFGFAKWVFTHADELFTLGEGRHFGEWWGSGIQRGYGLAKGERRFSLFNTVRWRLNGTPQDAGDTEPKDELPPCCGLVPVLYDGNFCTWAVRDALSQLETTGSVAQPGFMKPEGVVVFHTAANTALKATIEKDEQPKGFAK